MDVPMSATALSGLAVELTQGDAFLKSVHATEGPLRAYKEGREKGAFRKARARTAQRCMAAGGTLCWQGAVRQ